VGGFGLSPVLAMGKVQVGSGQHHQSAQVNDFFTRPDVSRCTLPAGPAFEVNKHEE
jgi:hypothetical protein